jgi:hypothetical protein
MKVDLVVLLLRFVVGFFFGGILFLCLSLVGGMPLKISGSIPLLVGLLAMIWGDKFIIGFMKLLGNWPT